ncbi:MAG: DNA repair protein RecO [bacterium]|nr:DNA repair protein RecO [bacterium]
MRTSKLTGLIIKRSNYGDANKLLTVFTREIGKTKLMAKGIRKIKSRRAPHLELFNLTSLQVYKDIITEAKIINDYSNLKSDLKTTGYLFYLSEVLDKILPEHQPHEEVFDKLRRSLPSLKSLNNLKNIVVELMWDLGYLPKGDYPKEGLTEFVESVVERKIRSKKFIEQI